MRAWNTTQLAYPGASVEFRTRETARACRVSLRTVTAHVTASMLAALPPQDYDWRDDAQFHVTDIQDDDSAGRANLH